MHSILTSALTGILLAPLNKEALYLDPGSGSIIIQLLVAGGLGMLYALRSYIGRFFGLFRKADNFNEDADETVDNDE
ncbi:MAG: hypothetical protein OEZ02_02315 [Anaerolineae bacterium]|nr:hypothetical protein [Anaerolineae bacterium]